MFKNSYSLLCLLVVASGALYLASMRPASAGQVVQCADGTFSDVCVAKFHPAPKEKSVVLRPASNKVGRPAPALAQREAARIRSSRRK